MAALLRAFPAQRARLCAAQELAPAKARVDDDCRQELRRFYDRRDLVEMRRDIAAWLGKWQAKYPRLCNWVEDNIEETLTYYRLPLPHPST